ncbi:hypothetical protein AB0E63_15705 [Kribbella sp. NPDC026596]|uniref:hypothetical protein n=1 Tax=Kribbella sp. NPDC026596 TaxID=3155122 RepID=UPI0033CD2ACB
MGEEARPARRRQGVVFALIIVGLLLALTNTNAQSELSRRRHASCDGTLPLPTSAYLLGFAGVVVGAIALFLMRRWFHHNRQPIALVLFTTATAAVVFEIVAVITAFQEGRPINALCFG